MVSIPPYPAERPQHVADDGPAVTVELDPVVQVPDVRVQQLIYIDVDVETFLSCSFNSYAST